MNSNNDNQLCRALCEFQKIVQQPEKSKVAKGAKFSYKYADLPDVIKALKPMHEFGLSYTQLVGFEPGCVVIKTICNHVSGEGLESVFKMPCQQTDAQSLGKIITYGRRYALSAMFGIAAEDDEDCNTVNRCQSPHLDKDLSFALNKYNLSQKEIASRIIEAREKKSEDDHSKNNQSEGT